MSSSHILMKLQDVGKEYRTGPSVVKAVHQASLTLEPREFVLLQGMSGSGKTTLLSIMGCLMKPFTAEDIHRSLAAAEDLMRGREALRPRMPVNLTLYDKVEEEGAEPQPGYIPSRRSLKTRLEHWIAGTQH